MQVITWVSLKEDSACHGPSFQEAEVGDTDWCAAFFALISHHVANADRCIKIFSTKKNDVLDRRKPSAAK